MQKILLICGVYNLAFAIFHIFFWKIFNWKKDLEKLHFANKGIIQILNVQLIFYFSFTAVICFSFSHELLHTSLGNFFLIANSLFWFIRTIQQFIYLRKNHYFIHLLSIIFIMGAILFLLPVVL